MKRILLTELLLLLIMSIAFPAFACRRFIKPPRSFSPTGAPRAPEYSRKDLWAALPERRDAADRIPANSGYRDAQASARADVFYIHPTTYLRGDSWNADLQNAAVNRRTDRGPILHQAGVFNSCCRIFAPRYRQATLYAEVQNVPDGRAALDLAYRDVRAAFQYYLERLGKNRPFILAAHGQGSLHALRLIQDLLEKNEALRKRLIAAYIPGVPAALGLMKKIPPCDGPRETGCILSWNTFNLGGYPSRDADAYARALCVNPLTWKRDGKPAGYDMNLGGVSRFFKRDERVSDAQCIEGILRISGPRSRDYPSRGNFDFRLMDYNLFYGNIRRNAKERTRAYFKRFRRMPPKRESPR